MDNIKKEIIETLHDSDLSEGERRLVEGRILDLFDRAAREARTCFVNRVEVVNEASGEGRAYSFWGKEGATFANIEIQDDGRTMKVFIRSADNR